jgi:hypothetical protein
VSTVLCGDWGVLGKWAKRVIFRVFSAKFEVKKVGIRASEAVGKKGKNRCFLLFFRHFLQIEIFYAKI